MSGLELILMLVLFAAGVGFGILILELLAILGRPRSEPNPYKLETYECGEIPIGARKMPISFQYYRFAIAFTAIDIFTMFFLVMGYVLESLPLLSVGLSIVLVLGLVLYVFRRSQ